MAASFPEINPGHIYFQLPFTEVVEFVVRAVTLECGITVTHAEHEDEMRRFRVRYDSIDRDELTVLEDFFEEMRGRTGEFDFPVKADGPDGEITVYPKTRFDQDELEISYPEPGRFSVDLKFLVQPS